MDRVVIYLKTSLFSEDKKEGHVPSSTMILEGNITAQPSGGFVVSVTGFRSPSNKSLEGSPCTLYIPGAKIDHMLLLD